MKNFLKKSLSFIKKYLTIFIILFIFLFLYVCDSSSSKVGNVIMNNLKSIATSFTPTTDLFDDGSEISFVGYFFGMKPTKQEEKLEFYLPTKNINISKTDDCLNYLFDGAISCIANGEVSAIGFLDNKKYVEITHSKGYVTRYIGLNNIGVSNGEKVKAKNLIGLCSSEEDVKIYIYQNGNLIKTSEVQWKN